MNISKNIRMMVGIAMVSVFCGVAAPASFAEEGGPPKLSTNPGKHVIFPAKDQTPEQQEQDQLAAYNWATQQTGWDPYKEAVQQADKAEASEEASDATRGAAVGGAARGALLGAAIGAAAGDAGQGAAIGATAGGVGRGMRARQTRKQLETGTDAGETDYQVKFMDWDKHFVAAMEGKGYTVK